MPRNELNERWLSCKKKVFKDYGKVIKGTLNSEKVFVKRYSQPLQFLKYKLKRATNLKISDLSPSDQAYYFEIGGIEDIDALRQQQPNIDSINVAATRMRKRRRITPRVSRVNVETMIVDPSNNYYPPSVESGFQASQSSISQQRTQPPVASTIEPKVEDGKFVGALNDLDEKLNAYEQEQLEKKNMK